ncbi:sugar phosphate isomerase/epimerase family protein [Tengunoibacter tsumagoiensis]|uniref:Xylose isomerase n=1 Tax=Tengunoibacter tsumagoiensis TaxID=2014871 RepID=A0A402A198_9CHLR|nr:TIM barrel protein [Tengunoibacter tsumagoiensis]GCE12918.1 xylose isomerase [Tengunoibacter tsumagoiensis]
MIRLSAFADEISPDLDEQIAVLKSENIHYIDFRAAWNTNVLDLTDQQIAQVKKTLAANGIGVAAIGSPIGKVPVDSPFDEHLERFERALTVAKTLEAPYIRIFSFYPPAQAAAATDPATYRDEVLRRLREMTLRASQADVILIHENEKGIYGDTIARCIDLLQSINDPHFLSVLDPANYLQCDQVPYPDAYDTTLPWLEYVHVKDVQADGGMVVAGEGEAHWPELLEQLFEDGYDGFLSLEPHLFHAGQYQGFSGADRFREASQALQRLLRSLEVPTA